MTHCSRIRRFGRFLAIGSIVFIAGCGEHFFRAETELHPDGSVTRAIFQPRSATPEDARRPDLWGRVTASKERPAERWPMPIAGLPDLAADDQHPYFAAIGTFPNSRSLPAHFLEAAPRGMESGRLVAETIREDFLFVTEHRWSETLTNAVSLPDVQRASAELADLGTDFIVRLFELDLGNEYDLTELRD